MKNWTNELESLCKKQDEYGAPIVSINSRKLLIGFFTQARKEEFERGYFEAIEDVEKAMKEAEVDKWHEDIIGFNDPKLFVEALKRLKKERFNATTPI